jgi:hypothetical protein
MITFLSILVLAKHQVMRARPIWAYCHFRRLGYHTNREVRTKITSPVKFPGLSGASNPTATCFDTAFGITTMGG